MKLEAAVADLVRKIVREWNRAERAIKIAEQVLGEDPFPSVKELRYAGRRFVEAFDKVDNGTSLEDTLALLSDALFDCFRAKHDAMDVAVNEISSRVKYAQDDLGVSAVISCFPEFPKLINIMSGFESKIAACREKRDTRDAIYEDIQTNFDEAIVLYDKFKGSESLMKQIADEAALRNRALVEKAEQAEARAVAADLKADRATMYSYGLACLSILLTAVFGYISL